MGRGAFTLTEGVLSFNDGDLRVGGEAGEVMGRGKSGSGEGCMAGGRGATNGGRPSASRPVGDPRYESVDCTNGSSGTEYIDDVVPADCGVSGMTRGASLTLAGGDGRYVSSQIDLTSPTSVGEGDDGALLSVSPRNPLPCASES